MLEKPSIDALQADEEFRPILEAHLRQEIPPSSGDRRGPSINLEPDITDAGKYPDKIWQSDTKMVNSESAIVAFNNQMVKKPYLTDLVICMGGDGTLLHAASIFQVYFDGIFFPSLVLTSNRFSILCFVSLKPNYFFLHLPIIYLGIH